MGKEPPPPPNKITLEGIVNCKLNEVLLCNVAIKMYPSFWIMHGNRNDLIACVGPVVPRVLFTCWNVCLILDVTFLKGSHSKLGNQRMRV